MTDAHTRLIEAAEAVVRDADLAEWEDIEDDRGENLLIALGLLRALRDAIEAARAESVGDREALVIAEMQKAELRAHVAKLEEAMRWIECPLPAATAQKERER